jgi:hypothetical protein
LRFVLTYVVVFLTMLAWWQVMLAFAGSDLPWLAVVVAYAGPIAAWLLLVTWGRGRARNEP